MFCESCSNDCEESRKYSFEDKDFFRGFFFGVIYGIALSGVILLR